MKREVSLPYGGGSVSFSIPEGKRVGVYEPRPLPPVSDPVMALREALRRAGLVLASAGGHPRDLNLYQAQKAFERGNGL